MKKYLLTLALATCSFMALASVPTMSYDCDAKAPPMPMKKMPGKKPPAKKCISAAADDSTVLAKFGKKGKKKA